MRIVLASASPRRKEILENIGLAPDVILPSDADESIEENTAPGDAVMLLAERKAQSILDRTEPDDLIIASDTAVVADGCFLGKPRDREDGFSMLKLLSGKIHGVYTGVCVLYQGRKGLFYDCTEVEFYPLTEEEINVYLDTGEPFDKAGAYGIQGRGSVLVKRINGDFFSVMGLPAARTARAVRKITNGGSMV